MQTSNKLIVFFDGVCGLCNSFVTWVIKHDRKERLFFSPIQGETFKEKGGVLEENAEAWTIVYLNVDGEFRYASDAVLDIFRDIGGMWRIIGWLRIFPTGFRNFFYRVVAKHRYQWFGKKDQCRIPTQAEQHKFLP